MSISEKENISLDAVYFTDFNDCIAYASEEKIDIAVIDMYLGKKLGIELAEKLRSIRGNSFQLIFISDKNSYVAETYELDACGYFLKPLNEELFRQLLMKYLK